MGTGEPGDVRRIDDEGHQVMGTKTVWRLAFMIGVIAIATGGAYLLYRFQVGRVAQGVVERADRAAEAKDFVRAAELYAQHLVVLPDDVEVQLKYADVIVKADPSSKKQQEALAIYEAVLGRFPGREDVRRRAAETASEMGAGIKARHYLASLMKTARDDGHLEYLMARCEERDKEYARAAQYYGAAIEHEAPERLDASQRLAVLLRDRLGRRDEADKVIDRMVKLAPGDYQVYLGRGRYLELERRSRRESKGGGDDFRKALELAPDRPEIYVELADAELRAGRLDAARAILDKGVDAVPKAVVLYRVRADLEQKAGDSGRAIRTLELGLKSMPDEAILHWQLALILAERGETGRLLLQVAELERLDTARLFTQYLRAYYHFNKHEFAQAKQILSPLQPELALAPGVKTLANVLLSRCYAELGEPELQQEATLRAVAADPLDMTARRAWIQGLISRGDIDQAIKEYRRLEQERPGLAGLQLASLLIQQNLRLPAAKRQWGEIEQLIDRVAAASPDAVEPALLRVQVLLAQGQEAKAFDALETARGKYPKDPRPWILEAELRTRQKRFKEARDLLDRADKQFGDRVDLRLARANLVASQGGSQVIPALNELTRHDEAFSREARRRLLTELAGNLGRLQDLAGAARAWARLAEEEPESLRPRLELFDLALRSKQPEEAEAQIQAIAKLDEQFGLFCRAQALGWQARAAGVDAAAKERLRGQARDLLNDLKLRRPDWVRIPLALAALNEQDLEDGGLDEAQKREKLESAISAYRRAIELGLRQPGIVRHVVDLLFLAGRGNEALEVYGQVPELVNLTSEQELRASQIALANRNYRQAEQSARKAVEANPQDFQARLWLVKVLMEDRRRDEAEAEIRKGIDLAQADPDRWITLVRFAVLTDQTAKAEKAAQDAEAHLAKHPLALAQCCQLVGGAFAAAEPDRAKSWFGQARHWLDLAQAEIKDPDDLTVKRRFAEFLLSPQVQQFAEAEGVLKEILARAGSDKSPEVSAWARRNLAQVYVRATPPRTAEAEALFAGKQGGAAEPDDLRVLAMIHEVQGTPQGKLQAIADLEALIGREAAGPDDRFALAQLLDAAGQWPRAREQFRELILRTDDRRDTETLNRRPLFIGTMVEALVRHHQTGDDSDLAEARRVVEKLRTIQANPMLAVLLEAKIDKAANQLEAANARIREFAGRPNLSVQDRVRLADQAELIGLTGEAEAIFRSLAAPNQILLALFLARRHRVKEAIDVCETLWTDPKLRDRAAAVCVQILGDPGIPLDKEQAQRVISRIERTWAEQPQPPPPGSVVYLIGLGALNERLGNYEKAKDWYRIAVKLNDRDGIAANNLAWLIALQGDAGKEALDLINKAIGLKGPVPEYLDTRGMIYLLTTGDGRRAIPDLESAVKNAPNGPKYFHLAQAYLKANEREKARKVLEAGKSRGLPGGLHPLEMGAYNQLASTLGSH